MARRARVKSKTDIYHIILKGNNRQTIFYEDEDYERFLCALNDYKETCGYRLYGYCFMGNHIHILMKAEREPLEQIFRRLCCSFVYWYNRKYGRVGNLFQDRFKSEPVEDDRYLLSVVRYIHQNPVKAGIVSDVGGYKWSSYTEYLGKPTVVDTDFVMGIIAENQVEAIEQFVIFNQAKSMDECMEATVKKALTDYEAAELAKEINNGKHISEIRNLDRDSRDRVLVDMKKEGLSIRQIERITGINRGIVLKA
jgi:REP element-mobilizing transposase RayT